MRRRQLEDLGYSFDEIEAIIHLQTIPNGRLDANQMFAAEKAARDWLEFIGEEL